MRIDARGICKRYGKVEALSGVDLEIPSGSRIALLGANGSGKTTLTRVIMGLIGHEGRLELDGAPPLPRSAAIAARTAYVPQIAPPWSAPVAEVVATVAALRQVPASRIEQAASRMGLDLAGVGRRPFRGLSGGNKQKLLIALALAVPASLCIFDEPTASLDAAARRRFLDLAQDAWDGATVVLCSHRLDELRALVDQIVVLADGKVAWRGPAARYLAEHLTSILELRVEGDDHRWLVDHGFSRATSGWWRRSVDAAEKIEVVPAAITALGPRIRDLSIHDLEKLDA